MMRPRGIMPGLVVAGMVWHANGQSAGGLQAVSNAAPVVVAASASAAAIPSVESNSPITYFRQLLAMSPRQRQDCLTNRPPAARARILQKINEYETLSPDERELRLRATELRWYVLPLLQLPPAVRRAQISRVPADLREIVQTRLGEWEILPQPLRDEFLENDRALYYFTRIQPPATSAQARVAAEERQQISDRFNQFLELTPDEKAQTLATLSTEERAQMQHTLEAFERLSPRQQGECVQNYARFAGMTAADRAEFLRNAERWSQMSPAERQTWRDLVANVPDWPPLPASIFPPSLAPDGGREGVATN